MYQNLYTFVKSIISFLEFLGGGSGNPRTLLNVFESHFFGHSHLLYYSVIQGNT